MERTGRLPIAVMAIGCLVGGVGCTMCPDPYDYSGPVPNGSVAQNDFHARSNGITPLGSVPLPWPTVVDGTPARGADAPTIAAAESESDSPALVPDDVLEIPTEASVLTDEEIASEPLPADDEAVRMLSAAEEASAEEMQMDVAQMDGAPESEAPAAVEPQPATPLPTLEPRTDEADAPAAARPLARPAPRPAAVPAPRPRSTARRSPASANRIARSPAAAAETGPERQPSAVEVPSVVPAESPRQPTPPVEPGLSETPGWRPRGYVRPAGDER